MALEIGLNFAAEFWSDEINFQRIGLKDLDS